MPAGTQETEAACPLKVYTKSQPRNTSAAFDWSKQSRRPAQILENKLHLDGRSWKYCGHDFQPATIAYQVNYKIKIDQVGKIPILTSVPYLCPRNLLQDRK